MNLGIPAVFAVEFLSSTGFSPPVPLLVGSRDGLRYSDINLLAKTGARESPTARKSNAKFGHGYAPFEKLIDAGITVGLGSDSVASNNVCDILEESRLRPALAARTYLDGDVVIYYGSRCSQSIRLLAARWLSVLKRAYRNARARQAGGYRSNRSGTRRISSQ